MSTWRFWVKENGKKNYVITVKNIKEIVKQYIRRSTKKITT